jgi:hypothetical protein
VEVEVIAAAKAAWGGGADVPLGGANLPSYISAFGEAAEDGAGGGATVGAASLDAADAYSGGGGGRGVGAAEVDGGGAAARLGEGYVPRTQDSGFSLDGERANNVGDADGAPPERADSGDSLQSLPKLQPVHRLTRSEVKVLAKIGEGAFGEVSRAQAPLYGTVAVKWLKVRGSLQAVGAEGAGGSLLASRG